MEEFAMGQTTDELRRLQSQGTTEILVTLQSPPLRDPHLQQPLDQVPEQARHWKRLRDRLRQDLAWRTYPEHMRRWLEEGLPANTLTAYQEAEIDLWVMASLYILDGIERDCFEKKPMGGDDVRRLISWKKRLLSQTAPSGPVLVPESALGNPDEEGLTGLDQFPSTAFAEPSVAVETLDLCRKLLSRLTEQQQQLIRLRLHQQEWAEIGRELGLARRGLDQERQTIQEIAAEFTQLGEQDFACLVSHLLAMLTEETD
jgi:hypothetical protein